MRSELPIEASVSLAGVEDSQVVIRKFPVDRNLATDVGLPVSELSYGIPSTITATTLDDGNTLTALSGSPASVNITFQSDGTVIDSTGTFARPTLFFYNNQVAKQTACAISILGGAGRIKVWRYSTSVNKYAE